MNVNITQIFTSSLMRKINPVFIGKKIIYNRLEMNVITGACK